MREIKFRGKREDTGEWIYGHLHVIDTRGEGYTGKAIQQQYGTSRPYSVRVHDRSVGQSTGLKDKNGREIYEGDVIDYEGLYKRQGISDTLLIAEWDVQDACFTFGGIRTDYAVRYGEVIGNTYENPELLEGEG